MSFTESNKSHRAGRFRSVEIADLKPQKPPRVQLEAVPDQPVGKSPTARNEARCPVKPEHVARMAITACRSMADVLGELHAMLEEYGPSWYTERHHERAENALRLSNCL